MMVLLSFDIEEFDMPLEYKGEISFEEQLSISRKGLQNILILLKKHQAKATFFSTVVFAENNKDLIEQLLSEGHELASHTWFHSEFKTEDLKKSREKLSELFQTEITGLRMPRMMKVDEKEVEKAGYSYNSSVNPTFLPGRYNNLKGGKMIKANGMDILVFEHDDNSSSITYKDGLTTYDILLTKSTMENAIKFAKSISPKHKLHLSINTAS